MRDTNLGDEPAAVTEFLEDYNITSQFETGLDRVHVQSLGMKIHSLEYGCGDYEFDLLDDMDGKAAVFYPSSVEFSAVLFFQTGWGYYCCQSPRDVDEIHEWFETELETAAEGDDSLINLPEIQIE